jgi:transposase InsO family protein
MPPTSPDSHIPRSHSGAQTKSALTKLREWKDFYDYHRPHGGLDGQTPYERLKQRTQTRP